MRRNLPIFTFLLLILIDPLTTQAGISNVKITNLSTRSFMVSWISSSYGPGRVHWGYSTGNLNAIADDTRLASTSDFYDPNYSPAVTHTHSVVLQFDDDATTCYFKIWEMPNHLYGPNGLTGGPYTVTTLPGSFIPPPSDVYSRGTVTAIDTGDELKPAGGALVHFRFVNAQGDSSSLMTTLAKMADGSYFLETKRYCYKSDFSSLYEIDLNTDEIIIESIGGRYGYRLFNDDVSGYLDHASIPGITLIDIDLELNRGDVNMDNVVNETDVQLLLNEVLDYNPSLSAYGQIAADLTNNGHISIADVIALIDLINP